MRYFILILALGLSQSAFAAWVKKVNVKSINTQNRPEIVDSFLYATDALDIMNADLLAAPAKSIVYSAKVDVGQFDWVNDADCFISNPEDYTNIVIEEFNYLFYYQNNPQQQFQLQGTGFIPTINCESGGSRVVQKAKKPTITKL